MSPCQVGALGVGVRSSFQQVVQWSFACAGTSYHSMRRKLGGVPAGTGMAVGMEAGSTAGAGAWGKVEPSVTSEATKMMLNNIVAGKLQF